MLSFHDDDEDLTDDDSSSDDDDDDGPGDNDPLGTDDNDSDKGESGTVRCFVVFFITLVKLGEYRFVNSCSVEVLLICYYVRVVRRVPCAVVCE